MQIYVKPRPGCIVRDPRDGSRLPEEGKAVNQTTFWMRRLEAGDVVLGNKKSAEAAVKAVSEKK